MTIPGPLTGAAVCYRLPEQKRREFDIFVGLSLADASIESHLLHLAHSPAHPASKPHPVHPCKIKDSCNISE